MLQAFSAKVCHVAMLRHSWPGSIARMAWNEKTLPWSRGRSSLTSAPTPKLDTPRALPHVPRSTSLPAPTVLAINSPSTSSAPLLSRSTWAIHCFLALRMCGRRSPTKPCQQHATSPLHASLGDARPAWRATAAHACCACVGARLWLCAVLCAPDYPAVERGPSSCRLASAVEHMYIQRHGAKRGARMATARHVNKHLLIDTCGLMPRRLRRRGHMRRSCSSATRCRPRMRRTLFSTPRGWPRAGATHLAVRGAPRTPPRRPARTLPAPVG